MEDIGGVSLAVVVGKVPEVQVNFHEKDIKFHIIVRKFYNSCSKYTLLSLSKIVKWIDSLDQQSTKNQL